MPPEGGRDRLLSSREEERRRNESTALEALGRAARALAAKDFTALAGCEEEVRRAWQAVLAARAAGEPIRRVRPASRSPVGQGDAQAQAGGTPPLISVLIPTLSERATSLDRLLMELTRQVTQHRLEDAVEILTFCDDRERPIGSKRNSLLMRARGRFVAFIDDDDEIHEEYLPILCSIIAEHPDIDCIGFVGELCRPDADGEPTIYSVRYRAPEDRGDTMGYCVRLRPPQHLNPMRRAIAVRYPFPEVRNGEDCVRGEDLIRAGALTREFFLGNRVLYRYHFDPRTSATAGVTV